jgi:hypothetical protein
MADFPLRILVAYPYMKTELIKLLSTHKNDIEFLLDSGAFTAWKAGKEIDPQEYIKFIKSLPFKPWRYFNLDKIGDPEGSFRNYRLMLDNDLNPLPVFTRGENIEMLEEYYRTSDVVAIGGLVGTKGNKSFVKGMMEKVGDRRVHWLGFTSADFVNHYKPYMCDCSSWSYATRYGDLQLYMGNGRIQSIHRREFYKKPPQEIYDAIASYGVDPRRLAFNESWKSNNNLVHDLVARSWVRRSLESELMLGTRLFLACASKDDVSTVLKFYKLEKERILKIKKKLDTKK